MTVYRTIPQMRIHLTPSSASKNKSLPERHRIESCRAASPTLFERLRNYFRSGAVRIDGDKVNDRIPIYPYDIPLSPPFTMNNRPQCIFCWSSLALPSTIQIMIEMGLEAPEVLVAITWCSGLKSIKTNLYTVFYWRIPFMFCTAGDTVAGNG